MSMKTTMSSNPGPDPRAFPSGVQAPRRPVTTPVDQSHSEQGGSIDVGRIAEELTALVDRSAAQLAILRTALDEAAAAESSARRTAETLAHQSETLAQAGASLDARLSRCESAESTFRKAALALDELNDVAGRIRSAAAAIDQRVNAQLADQQRRIDALTADHDARFAARIAELEATFASHLIGLGEVHSRATAAAHNACERAVQSARAAGANATEASRQTIAAVEEDIAARTSQLTARLRQQAADAATEAVLHVAQAREADDVLRERLEQAAHVVDLLDRRLAEILEKTKVQPLRRAA